MTILKSNTQDNFNQHEHVQCTCIYALQTLSLLAKMSSLYQSFLQFLVTVDVPFEVFHTSIEIPLLTDELLEVLPM